MIIYNVTVKIDNSVHEEWLRWMKNTHIPDVMRTGCFLSNRMHKVLGDDSEDGITYAIQYECSDLSKFEKYQNQFAAALQEEHHNLYAGQYGAFRTLLELVSESHG